MKIFLSVGSTYSDEQEQFVLAFETFLQNAGCECITVGRGYFGVLQPIVQVKNLMESVDAVVVLAFTRLYVKEAVEKPGSTTQKIITNAKYPTAWNQLESALAFGMSHPILFIVEEGLHQEAMLEDKHEFQTLYTNLEPSFFSSDLFRKIFADFRAKVKERKKMSKPNIDLEKVTIGELFQNLSMGQLVKIVGVLVACLVSAFWLGKSFGHLIP